MELVGAAGKALAAPFWNNRSAYPGVPIALTVLHEVPIEPYFTKPGMEPIGAAGEALEESFWNNLHAPAGE
jgi:hypothetical protein